MNLLLPIFEGYRLIIQTNDKLYTVRPCNKPSILVQYTIFFSGRKSKTKQNAAPLEVVYATSERFNKPSRRFIFAYFIYFVPDWFGLCPNLSTQAEVLLYTVTVKISPLFKVNIGDFKN